MEYAYCANRGNRLGDGPMSVDLGAGNVDDCAASVAANPLCGYDFSFGTGLSEPDKGWCDCVPAGQPRAGTSGRAYGEPCDIFPFAPVDPTFGNLIAEYSAYRIITEIANMSYWSPPRAGTMLDPLPPEATVEGVSLGQSYSFRVRALNEIGWGSWSQWSEYNHVYGPPAAPTALRRVL